MWDKLKRFFDGRTSPRATANDYTFTWHEPGPENPFPMRVLDVRSLTHTVVATTTDQKVADSYVRLRSSDGRDLIDAAIPDGTWLPGALRFPHNGAPLDGIVHKAESMDVKWDIYIYNDCFLFARSWTGELKYRARARIETSALILTEIECPKTEVEIARAHVFFILASHAMKRVLPHQLPPGIPDDPMMMATLSFNLFGNRACYATFSDITQLPLEAPAR